MIPAVKPHKKPIFRRNKINGETNPTIKSRLRAKKTNGSMEKINKNRVNHEKNTKSGIASDAGATMDRIHVSPIWAFIDCGV